MKTTTIDMSKADIKNVFEGVEWKEATQDEIKNTQEILNNYKK